MTRRKTIHRYCFHVCVHGIVLLATLCDNLKKQAEERALDVERQHGMTQCPFDLVWQVYVSSTDAINAD